MNAVGRAYVLDLDELSLDAVLSELPLAVYVKRCPELRLIYANERAIRYFGEGSIGKTNHELLDEGHAFSMVVDANERGLLEGAGVPEIQATFVDGDGSTRWVRASVRAVGGDGSTRYVLGSVEDVTDCVTSVESARATTLDLERRVQERTAELLETHRELHAREEQLRQAQKLEAIGRLAGGIAHDFNNLLGVILGYAHSLEAEVENDDQRSDATEVRRAAERAAELTQQLLAFGRKQVLAPKVVNLHAIASGLSRMLGRLIGATIEVRIESQADLGKVRVDPGQIEQVIVNLAINARDAMPHGGSIVIQTKNVVFDDVYVAAHPGATLGANVLLEVSDNGLGMDGETLARVFEPFFTTKALGRGTGLGLATVFGIVQQSEGCISVESEPGEGTTFRISFPRVHAPSIPAPTRLTPQQGHETVLVVEDDDLVRTMVCATLERHGYRVVPAISGEAALALGDRLGAVDVLLSDVVMPGMDGVALAQRLVALQPRLRVLLMSGYTREALTKDRQAFAFIPKPFSPVALLAALRRVLDAETSSTDVRDVTSAP